MRKYFRFLWFVSFAVGLDSFAGVVINEIFYHAPKDFDDLEWVELHNPDQQAADISGWSLAQAVSFRFPDKTTIPAGGFVVVCKRKDIFGEFYDAPVAGEFKKSMSNSGETLELTDSKGATVDRVRFTDRSPWSAAADGQSSSLERITPGAPGDDPANWSASPLPKDEEDPAGSPGKANAVFSAHFPPIIRNVTVLSSTPKPGEPIQVEATIESASGLDRVEALYQTALPGELEEEKSVAMKSADGKKFVGEIPAQSPARLLRMRVRAVAKDKAERLYPSPNDLRPALSFYIQEKPEMAKIPLAYFIHTDPREFATMERLRKASQRPSGPFQGPQTWQLQQMLSQTMNLGDAWLQLTFKQTPDAATYRKLRQIFVTHDAEHDRLLEDISVSGDLTAAMETAPAQFKKQQDELVAAVGKELSAVDAAQFEKWASSQSGTGGRDLASFLKQLVPIESQWLALNLHFELSPEQIASMRPVFEAASRSRAEEIEAAQKVEPTPANFPAIQAKFAAVEKKLSASLDQQLSLRQRRFIKELQGNAGSPMRPRLVETPPRPPRGHSAFIFIDQDGKPEVFDFIHITERSAGYKVRFHQDHLFRKMSAANIIFEYNDRFTLAEPLAFKLYNDVGNAACNTDFVRLSLNGHLAGYYLLVEQVNGAFLRRNNPEANGDLFKILWYGNGIEGQHEKQNNPDRDHSELIALVDSLQNAKGDEQWQVIQKNFNVDQVINYFAVNMVLSHWDGFFNNYFTFYDRAGSKKWEMYPWDQDKTWGFHDSAGVTVFFNMPLTFGMAGDKPPGGGQMNFRGWWRPAGFFSGPLLANPEFRKRFLQRTRQILEETYTQEKYFPVIDAMGERLKPEIPTKAKARGEDPAEAMQRHEQNIESLKEHLVKRREFLLKQPELAALK